MDLYTIMAIFFVILSIGIGMAVYKNASQYKSSHKLEPSRVPIGSRANSVIRSKDVTLGEVCDTHDKSFAVSHSSGVTVFTYTGGVYTNMDYDGYIRTLTFGNRLLRTLDDSCNIVQIDNGDVLMMESPVLAMGSYNDTYGVLISGECVIYSDCACNGEKKLNEKLRLKVATNETHNQVLITKDMIYITTGGFIYKYTYLGKRLNKFPGRFVATDGVKDFVSTSNGIVVYENGSELYTIGNEGDEQFGVNVFSTGKDEIIVGSLSNKVHVFADKQEQLLDTKCSDGDVFIVSGANSNISVIRKSHVDGSVLIVVHNS